MAGIDYESAAALAVCIVGITQLVKCAAGKELKGRAGLFLTLAVGAAVCALYFAIPERWGKASTVLLSLSGAGIFYDTIYQSLRRLFERGGKE